MARMITVREAALRWGITERRILTLCNEGRIIGAVKEGRSWLIPADAKKPSDRRYKREAPAAAVLPVPTAKLPLPVGVSDYRTASTSYYYVDKTLMIRDFLDERPKVSLFTRPRRFGKSLNMDMLRVFFEISDENTAAYFRGKKIWLCGAAYRAYQGRYPVISLTFKDVKCLTWQETMERMAELIGSEFVRHAYLADAKACSSADRTYYRKVTQKACDETELSSALLVLSRMLHAYHGSPAVIIIDEYDTPIQQGHAHGFYDQVIMFMRNFFSGGLKDNPDLAFGFLTGILRIAKESIFSGLNNLVVNSVLDQPYSEYFGFTADEVHAMARYYDAEDKYEELCAWYDGYRFGAAEIFNPWSVINYFRSKCQPNAYWQSTGSNEFIGEILEKADQGVLDKLQRLLQGETVSSYIDTGVVYPEVGRDPSSVFSFLLVAGYLKAVRSSVAFTGDFMCEVALPNREIACVYRKEIMQRLSWAAPQSTVIRIQEALWSGNAEALRSGLKQYLLEVVSFHNTVGENFYHGLMLGLCTTMEPYKATSNRESGLGRYDIQLKPKRPGLPGILIELKAADGSSGTALAGLAEEGLRQIREKYYEAEMKAEGVQTILCYGVAFSGKNAETAMDVID